MKSENPISLNVIVCLYVCECAVGLGCHNEKPVCTGKLILRYTVSQNVNTHR
jgi:hypothetical protein